MSEEGTASTITKLAALSGLQIKAILTALIATVAGFGGMAWTWIDQKDDQQHVAAMPEDVRSAVERSTEDDPSIKETDAQTWTEWFSTKGVRLGLSFLGGFALGYAFRTFLKTMAILTALAVTTIVLLSYFNVYNVDFTQVQEKWDSNSEWITTQATKLKDFVWTYIPSSTAAFVGFFIGMLRK
jgi:uncharacterized membrane protein (Fun14 family)